MSRAETIRKIRRGGLRAIRTVGRPIRNPYPTDRKLTAFIPEEVHRGLKTESGLQEKPMVTLVVEALIKAYGYGELIKDDE